MRHTKKFLFALAPLLLLATAVLLAVQTIVFGGTAIASSHTTQGAFQVYLPFVVSAGRAPTPAPSLTPTPSRTTPPSPSPAPSPTSTPAPGASVRRVNAPYYNTDNAYSWAAIFWFGQVNPLQAYADGRVFYNDQKLWLSLNIIDRRLWYNPSPTTTPLTDWDAASLYLDLDGNKGSAPSTNSYRLEGQLSWWEPRADYQAAYRGNGSNWVSSSMPFTTTTGWRGNAPNDDTDDEGWSITYEIPFTSLGLSGPPPQGTRWGLALVLHNRDYLQYPPQPDENWPENVSADVPSTWGQLNFGLPTFTPPSATPRATVTIRQGLNGAVVPDAAVGGTIDNLCGQSQGTWDTWGNANFAGAPRFNIQNESDISDWMCFSKYYVTFPLDSLPSGKAVISATLTLHEFGNSGQQDSPCSSLIQVLTLNDDWSEASITWNNAPLARENVSQAVVDPITNWPGWPGVPWSWDVSSAVAKAYAAGHPLRLVLYEADSAYDSGKYFLSSDEPDWDARGRPTLNVLWGDP
jgi:hypothetical protein